MSQALSFRHLLTPDGWQHDCVVRINDVGKIISIEPGDGPWDGILALPGLPNAHSHVFQRALAGYGEAAIGKDSFWSWRDSMYRLASLLDPEDMYWIACFAYREMLCAGYTCVGEFHYLHHRRDGNHGTDMAEAILAAARDTGIRLRLLPVLYQQGGFGEPPDAKQRRFIYAELDGYLDLLSQLIEYEPGIALHSLRAVSAEMIPRAVKEARALLGEEAPVHLHIAEQQAEVDGCLDFHGKRPVELLDSLCEIDSRWSLVHATHATDTEYQLIRSHGATIVLCPLTEAYLGDGIFRGRDYLASGGIAIGSDSQCRIDPVEELRCLEYGQRLRYQARAQMADSQGLGPGLWRRVGEGGGKSLGLSAGQAMPGCYADFIVVDVEHPALLGHESATWLDALVVSGDRTAISKTFVGGRPAIAGFEDREGRAIANRYRTITRQFRQDLENA